MKLADFQSNTDPSRLASALALADGGYSVFPLRRNAKTPLTRHGFHDATTDAAQITDWWTKHPDANIGIACGASGIIVADLDVKSGENGPGNWAELVRHIEYPSAVTVSTPSGGTHLIWRGTGVASSNGEVAPGVDIKADGGYIVAPGSAIDGVAYRTSDGRPLPRIEELPAASEGLKAAQVSRKAIERRGNGAAAQGAAVPVGNLLSELLDNPPAEGGRNDWLSRVAGHYAARHRHESDLYERHTQIANNLLADPLDDTEFQKTIWSVWNIEQAKPQVVTEDDHAQAVAAQVERMVVQHEARIQFQLRQAELDPAEPFDAGSLREILDRPADDAYRVEGLIPAESSTVIMAKRKTGKTTFNLNLTRALLLGGEFLGAFTTHPLKGSVAILNFEVTGRQLASWAADVGIPDDRLYLVNLRGRRNPLSHPADRAELAAQLKAQNVEALFVDPFGRAFAGNQNDAGEVSAWLVDLDTFARSEVGATELILNVHAGWNGDRSRGSSALEDWPDSIIRLTTKDDDENGARFLSALGRDVDVPEDELHFDPTTRLLSLTGAGSRRSKRTEEKIDTLVEPVVAVVAAHPGIKSTEVSTRLRTAGVSFQKGAETKALASAVASGLLVVVPGARNAKNYFPAGMSLTVPLDGTSPGLPTHNLPAISPRSLPRHDGISPDLPGSPRGLPPESPRRPKRGGDTGRFRETTAREDF